MRSPSGTGTAVRQKCLTTTVADGARQGDHAFERREDSTLLVRRIEHDEVEPIVLAAADAR